MYLLLLKQKVMLKNVIIAIILNQNILDFLLKNALVDIEI